MRGLLKSSNHKFMAEIHGAQSVIYARSAYDAFLAIKDECRKGTSIFIVDLETLKGFLYEVGKEWRMSNLKVGDEIILKDGTIAVVTFTPQDDATKKVIDRLQDVLEKNEEDKQNWSYFIL